MLPERDREGRRVVFSVARNLDPARHSNSDAMRAHIITFEVRGYCSTFVQPRGLCASHMAMIGLSPVNNR